MKHRLLLVAIKLATGMLHAQTTDTVRQSMLDSIDAKMKMMKLKEISISAPKPVYSMTGEVVYKIEAGSPNGLPAIYFIYINIYRMIKSTDSTHMVGVMFLKRPQQALRST